MANTILLKRNSTPGSAPAAGSLSQGELAINTADGRLYTKNSSNQVTELTVKASNTTTITANAQVGYVGFDLTTTGVSAGTYGDGAYISQITVDAKGRISSASNVKVGTVDNALTANVSLWSSTNSYTTGTFYPTFSNVAGGNSYIGTNSSLTFNATNGNLSATGFVGTHWGTINASSINVSGSAVINSNLVAASGTASTNTTTGALVVVGGAGVSGALNVGGATKITNTTESYSTTTGALQVSGGVGVTGNVWIGGNLYVANIVGTTYSQLTVSDPLLYLTANTPQPYSYDIGIYSQFVGGPVNAYGHTGFVRSQASNVWILFSNVASEPTNTINWNDTGIIYDAIKVGAAAIANTTTSTSTSTGALTVAGGAGIAGAVYAGSVYDNGTRVVSTSTGGGSLVISSGAINLASVGSASTYGNATYVAQITTDAYGRVSSASNVAITFPTFIETSNVSLFSSTAVYSSATNNTISTFYVAFSNVAGGNSRIGTTSGFTWNANTGNVTAPGHVGTHWGPVAATTANVSSTAVVNGNLVAASSTASTNATTGALVVIGGLGVGGNININGSDSNAIVTSSSIWSGSIYDRATGATYLNSISTIDGGTY